MFVGRDAVGAEDDQVPTADRDLEDAAGVPDDSQRDAERLVAVFQPQDDRLRREVLAVPLAARPPAAVGGEAEALPGRGRP